MNLTVCKTFALICISTLVSLIVGLTALDSLAAEQEPKRVFVLNSFNREYIWTANMLHGIDDAFGSSGISVETYVTFMDMKRIPSTPQYFSKIKEMIKEGYKGVRFDAVLACDNDALEFIRQYRDELFPGVPVAFSSINDFDERMLGGRRDITGTSENNDYTGTVKIALKLLPATKNIIVVVDNTTTGKAHRSAVQKIRSDFPQRIVFTYLSLGDMTLSELAQKLSKLSSDSIVLLLHHFADRNGTTYTVTKSTPLLTQSSSVPVFVLADIRMGMGVLGGHVVSGYHHGEAAAQMVVKILSGTDVRSIPVLLDSPNKYMFDYSVMQRFGITENNIPKGSILINKPVSFYAAHRGVILTALAIIVFLSIIIVLLIINSVQRKRSSETLQESEECLAFVLEGSQLGFWDWDIETGAVKRNARWAEMLGYTLQEIEYSVKQWTDLHHPDDRAAAWQSINDHLEGRTPEHKIEYRMRMKDGQYKWILDQARVVKRDVTGKPLRMSGSLPGILPGN
jgi:PAS domain S-box-containing protein